MFPFSFDRNPHFVHSAVVHIDGSSLVNDSYRPFSTAYLRRRQTAVVRCIEQRFAQFQGDIDSLRLEPLQIVKYESHQLISRFLFFLFRLVQTTC